MKKVITLALVGLLALCLVGPATAKKKPKKPKKPTAPVVVPVDQKFYLRRDGCGAAEGDNTRLSLEDGPDGACSWDDSGIIYEALRETGLLDTTTVFAAENGMPLTLDASKHVTGELTLYHGPMCAEGQCAPTSANAGQAHFTARVIATVGGEDKEIGVVDEEFTSLPGESHVVKIDLEIDPALNGAIVEGFRLETFHGGQAVGPGGISYDDPASFVMVPSLVTQTP